MKTEKLITDDRGIVLDRLRGQVFHLTTLEAYRQIELAGEISNNKEGTFPINTGSKSSYGRLNSCVCLFDIRHNDPDAIKKTLESHYNFLGPPWFSKHGRKYISWNLAYLILDQKYYDQIIPNSQVHDHCRETGEYLQAIPESEVWVNTKVPLSWIEKALLVTIRELAPDRNTFAGAHYWAVLKAAEKR
jgi:hypothetical protein